MMMMINYVITYQNMRTGITQIFHILQNVLEQGVSIDYIHNRDQCIHVSHTQKAKLQPLSHYLQQEMQAVTLKCKCTNL